MTVCVFYCFTNEKFQQAVFLKNLKKTNLHAFVLFRASTVVSYLIKATFLHFLELSVVAPPRSLLLLIPKQTKFFYSGTILTPFADHTMTIIFLHCSSKHSWLCAVNRVWPELQPIVCRQRRKRFRFGNQSPAPAERLATYLWNYHSLKQNEAQRARTGSTQKKGVN